LRSFVHHRLRLLTFPMRTLGASCHRSNVRHPRFRRVPFVRDVFFDHGRASVPRIAGPHMLPSTLLTGSASAVLWLSRLNSTPHTIAVYASHPPSPATTQHSLPGARYGLPGPVSHRLDNASLPGAQAIQSCPAHARACGASSTPCRSYESPAPVSTGSSAFADDDDEFAAYRTTAAVCPNRSLRSSSV